MAARAQDPVQLGQRHRRVEPVERLRHGHRVHRPVVQGQGLGGAVVDLDAGEQRRQPVAHAGHGLDRHHVGAGGDEQAGQLAGACGQVEDPGAGADAADPDDVGDGLGRVPGPGHLVGAGVGVEPAPRP